METFYFIDVQVEKSHIHGSNLTSELQGMEDGFKRSYLIERKKMRNVIALFVDEKYVLINSELAGFQYNFVDQKSCFFVLTV